MADRVNRRIVLANRPKGAVQDSDFRIEEGPVPVPDAGQFLVRNLMLSFEPTQRGWLNDRQSYVPPVAIGEVMRSFGAGQVVDSNHPEFPVGTLVQGALGWQDYVATDGKLALGGISPIRPGVPLEKALGVFSTTGLTAYFGMRDVAQVKEGDVVLVSAAAGATGSVAGQIARLLGASRVIGIAGGESKCAWVRDVASFEACIDYRSEKVRQRIRELAPDGVDVYFDNVGGDILEAAIDNLALHARVALCGAISSGYGMETPPQGPRNLSRLIERRSRMEGFLVLDFAPRFGEAVKRLAEWVAQGRIATVEDVQEGLENAPATLRRLFEGGNLGKQLLRIAEAPAI
jgi:NADPH-dependent curcumin reductase CurA